MKRARRKCQRPECVERRKVARRCRACGGDADLCATCALRLSELLETLLRAAAVRS